MSNDTQALIRRCVGYAEGFNETKEGFTRDFDDSEYNFMHFYLDSPEYAAELQFGLDALAAELVRLIQGMGYQVLVNNHWSGEVRLSIYNTTNGGDFCQHYDNGLLPAIDEFMRGQKCEHVWLHDVRPLTSKPNRCTLCGAQR